MNHAELVTRLATQLPPSKARADFPESAMLSATDACNAPSLKDGESLHDAVKLRLS